MKLDYHIATGATVPFVGIFATTDDAYKAGDSVDAEDLVQIEITGNAVHQAQLAKLISDIIKEANNAPSSTVWEALEAAYNVLPTSTTAVDFISEGTGNWGLTEVEMLIAEALSKVIVTNPDYQSVELGEDAPPRM